MIGSVYDYYLTTYGNFLPNKNDTHKKSELKDIYNNIVKISKTSPLYKVEVSSSIQKFAIDLKENARLLANDIRDLTFENKIPISSKYVSDNSDVVSVNVLDPKETSDGDKYVFEVKNLATPQVNTSKFLYSNDQIIYSGEHTFELSVNDNTYEFQFNIGKGETSLETLEKLSRLINKADIGLSAKVLNTKTTSALEITSNATGASFSSTIFDIKNSPAENGYDLVGILGLNRVSTYPSNANFVLNGMEKSSSGNTFTVNNAFEITLKKPNTPGESTTITRSDDLNWILDSVDNLISTYNKLVDVPNENSSGIGNNYTRLDKEMVRTARYFKNDLESIGLNLDESGHLSIDKNLFSQCASEDSIEGVLDKLDAFKKSLAIKSSDISINPMKYVNKTMISYPNPIKGKNFANPYMTSIYSGMMFNGYT